MKKKYKHYKNIKAILNILAKTMLSNKGQSFKNLKVHETQIFTFIIILS